ncbi:MAG: hypothetical protein IPI60_15535 [Saprospiraceae bacterium]|nr:hypothetical protein [Saprospiraceae bacterium]
MCKKRNCRIRLLANARLNPDGTVSLYVVPALVRENDPFYNINAEMNAIEIEGKYSGTHLLSGKGAGSYPTASALVSDLQAASEGFRYKYSKYRRAVSKKLGDEKLLSVYLRYADPKQFNSDDFESVQSKLINIEGLIVEGKIKLATLLSNPKFKGKQIFVMQIPFT